MPDRSKTLPMGYELSNKETIDSLKPSFITLADILKDAKQIITTDAKLKEQLLAIDPSSAELFNVRVEPAESKCGDSL